MFSPSLNVLREELTPSSSLLIKLAIYTNLVLLCLCSTIWPVVRTQRCSHMGIVEGLHLSLHIKMKDFEDKE